MTRTVSWSEVDAARQCPFKHRLQYRERWESPEVSRPLAVGKLWHEVMQTHYSLLFQAQRAGVAPDATAIAKAVFDLLYEASGTQTEYQELVEWMYEGYLRHYQFDPQWQIVAIEHASEVWLPTAAGTRSGFKLKIKVDLIVRERGKIWLIDHKSGRDLPREPELALADQFGLYNWALRKIGHKPFGVIHSAARTQRNKSKPQPLEERFLRTYMYRTDAELERIAVEAWRTMKSVYALKPELAPRYPDPDRCGWRCSYTEPCLASRKGADLVQFLHDVGFAQNFERH